MKDDWDGAHAYRVKHPPQDCYTTGIGQGSAAGRERAIQSVLRGLDAMRQCLACGVLAECDPSRPCAACGASHFHLIPERRELATW